MKPTPQPIAERFWNRVMRGAESECWLWKGSTNGSGYGYFSVSGEVHGAHHVAWALAYGPIPRKLHVLHRCDMPRCVNPTHLFLGSHADNMADMARKGRNRGRPSTAPECAARPARSAVVADLTPEQIESIRRLLVAGYCTPGGTLSHSSIGIARYLKVPHQAVEEILLESMEEEDTAALK